MRLGTALRDAVWLCSGQRQGSAVHLRRWESELRMTEEQVLTGDREAQPVAKAEADTTDDTGAKSSGSSATFTGGERDWKVAKKP